MARKKKSEKGKKETKNKCGFASALSDAGENYSDRSKRTYQG